MKVQDIIQDLIQLSKQDGISRIEDLHLLEYLDSQTDMEQVEQDVIDFWNWDNEPTAQYNSYNWNGLSTFEIKEFRDYNLVGIAFHRAGDARGNYTEAVWFTGTAEQLLITINDCNYDTTINDWTVCQSYLSEQNYITAFNHATGEEYEGYDTGDNCPEDLRDCTY